MDETPTPPDDGLKERHRRFVDAYMADPSPAEAARAAGYSPHTAKEIGYQLAHKPAVAAAIAQRQEARAARMGVRADEVLGGLIEIATFDPASVLDFSGSTLVLRSPCEIPESGRRCISWVKVRTRKTTNKDGSTEEVSTIELKFTDRLEALKCLMRHLGIDRKAISLETILSLFPPALAAGLREAIARCAG